MDQDKNQGQQQDLDREPAEGSRRDDMRNRSSEDSSSKSSGSSGSSSGSGSSGISKRGMDRDLSEQDELPERGSGQSER